MYDNSSHPNLQQVGPVSDGIRRRAILRCSVPLRTRGQTLCTQRDDVVFGRHAQSLSRVHKRFTEWWLKLTTDELPSRNATSSFTHDASS